MSSFTIISSIILPDEAISGKPSASFSRGLRSRGAGRPDEFDLGKAKPATMGKEHSNVNINIS